MSPELRAMMDEQEKYNRWVNLMLETLQHCPPRDMEELTLWTDGKDTVRADLPCEGRPIFKEEA